MVFETSDGIIIPADMYHKALKSLSCSRVYKIVHGFILNII